MSLDAAALTATAAQCKGYVTKCGGSVRSWKKRWMVLKDGTIFYYTNEKAKAPKGTLELEADDSAHAVRNSDKSPFMFGINTTKRTYLMFPDSEDEQQRWISAVTAAVALKKKGRNPGSAPITPDRKASTPDASAAPSPRLESPMVTRLKGTGDSYAQRVMTMSSPTLAFEPRDCLLFAKDTLPWIADRPVLERFWELWIRHLPATISASDDEDDDAPESTAPAEGPRTAELQFTLGVSTGGKSAFWEGETEQHALVQRVVDFLYAVGADDGELTRNLTGAGSIVQPATMSLWLEMSADVVVEGGFSMKVVEPAAALPALVAWLKHAKLAAWVSANASRVSLTQLWRECSSRARKAWRLEFACRYGQVELLVSSLGLPPLPVSVVTSLRIAKSGGDAVSNALRLWALDDGTIGGFEILLPDDEGVAFPDLNMIFKAARSRPTHVAHRMMLDGVGDLYPAGYSRVLLWLGCKALRESFQSQ